MDALYKNPRYYEIAFSYRDIPHEVDVLEECMRRYSLIPVEKVLELGCGNSPHMEELLKRGYQYAGIDISEEMIRYSKSKASSMDKSAYLVRADMRDFSLEFDVDFVFIMLGSLYVKNNDELTSHLDSVNRALRSGGLYFLDWCVNFSPLNDISGSWESEVDGIKVKTRYSARIINKVEQLYEESISVVVNDNGLEQEYTEYSIKKAIYPQEFLLLLRTRSDFDFIGWWNNWNLDNPLEGTEEISRPIILLRKR